MLEPPSQIKKTCITDMWLNGAQAPPPPNTHTTTHESCPFFPPEAALRGMSHLTYFTPHFDTLQATCRQLTPVRDMHDAPMANTDFLHPTETESGARRRVRGAPELV